MSVVADLTLVRHAESVANVAFPRADARAALDSGLTGRDADVALSDLGRVQSAALGRWLADLPPQRRPEAVGTSPYLRARETWRIAAETSGLVLPVAGTDDRLVDRLTGDLEMLTAAAIAEQFPAEEARRRSVGDFAYRPPNGEAFTDIADRLTSFLADLNQQQPGRRVLVVAHDAIVLMMRAVIERLDLATVAAIDAAGRVRNASITHFDGSSGQLVLTRYNAVDHLRLAR